MAKYFIYQRFHSVGKCQTKMKLYILFGSEQYMSSVNRPVSM